MSKNQKMPKDLGLKIGSKLEVFWTAVRDSATAELVESKNAVILGEAMIKLAEEKIAEEKATLESSKR